MKPLETSALTTAIYVTYSDSRKLTSSETLTLNYVEQHKYTSTH